ncbi:hypothetical protein ACMYYO_01430 [Dermacoccaceae bacterium W4C1]
MKPVRVLIVGGDNLMRSAMTEVVAHSLLEASSARARTELSSAGLLVMHPGATMHPLALQALSDVGLDGSAHQATQFELDDFLQHDLVIFMDSRHVDLVAGAGPPRGWQDRVHLLRSFDPVATALGERDLADPRIGGAEAVRLSLKAIRSAVPRLIQRVEKLAQEPLTP